MPLQKSFVDRRCFQVRRTYNSCRAPAGASTAGVVEIKPVMNGKKPTPKLEIKKVYIMLPVKRGKPEALSSEEARKVSENANSFLKPKSVLSSSGFLPLFVRICPTSGGVGHDNVFTKTKKYLVERKDRRNQSQIISGKFWRS